jgi:hypothetical protein
MLTTALALPVGLQSCTLTKNSDGSYTGTFSPELAITAQGLEDALQQTVQMLNDCMDGYLSCTPEDVIEIAQSIDRILDTKKHFAPHSGATPNVPQPKPTPPPQPG